MLRIGVIGLGLSLALFTVLFAGTSLNVVRFGPCGPDMVGLCLLGGILLSGSAGVLLLLFGLIAIAVRKLRMHYFCLPPS
jgi:hypothetical protein